MSNELFNIVFAIDTTLVQQLGNAFVFGRVQVAEAVIFQLPFYNCPMPKRLASGA